MTKHDACMIGNQVVVSRGSSRPSLGVDREGNLPCMVAGQILKGPCLRAEFPLIRHNNNNDRIFIQDNPSVQSTVINGVLQLGAEKEGNPCLTTYM